MSLCAGRSAAPRACKSLQSLSCSRLEQPTMCDGVLDTRCVACAYPPNSEPVDGTAERAHCNWRCALGFALNAETGACDACEPTPATCGVASVPRACARDRNAHCAPCPPPPARGAYSTVDSCAVDCAAGFFYNAAGHRCCSDSAYSDAKDGCKCLPGWTGDGEQCTL
jgi:hypothetical protein